MSDALPQWLLDRPIAHRGLHRPGIPENSLAAFDASAAAGFAIELDVRVLADGTAVVFHDDNFARMTGHDLAVARATRGDLGALPLDGTGEAVPTLEEALERVAGRVGVLVEIKNEGVARDVEPATLDAIRGYAGPVAVQSFNPLTMQWFAVHAADLARGLLSGDFRDAGLNPMLRDKLMRLEMLEVAAPDFIGYDVRCLPFEPVSRARESGLPVLGWTVRDVDGERAARTHCDNIIFEGYVPDV